jgi:hypothetical protein
LTQHAANPTHLLLLDSLALFQLQLALRQHDLLHLARLLNAEVVARLAGVRGKRSELSESAQEDTGGTTCVAPVLLHPLLLHDCLALALAPLLELQRTLYHPWRHSRGQLAINIP